MYVIKENYNTFTTVPIETSLAEKRICNLFSVVSFALEVLG